MPLIDVSEILSDPDFVDDFSVIRSGRTVDSHGRAIDTPATFLTYGNVQPARESQLGQIPELERVGSFISVVTQFELFPLTDTTAPDRIVWNHRTYQVRLLRDWTAYGNGFVEAICELISLTVSGP